VKAGTSETIILELTVDPQQVPWTIMKTKSRIEERLNVNTPHSLKCHKISIEYYVKVFIKHEGLL
jgi:hypothetical protein